LCSSDLSGSSGSSGANGSSGSSGSSGANGSSGSSGSSGANGSSGSSGSSGNTGSSGTSGAAIINNNVANYVLTATGTAGTIQGNAGLTFSSGTLTATTFSGALSGNASTATQVTQTLTGTNTANLLYSQIADNDYARIRVGGDASNTGWMELATADDGNEPIYVRQYTGVFATVTRTATLLDGSGNTSFPGTVTAPTFSGNATTATTAGALTSMNISQFTNNSGYITSDSTKLPLAGGTLTGDLRFNNAGYGRIAFTDNYHGVIIRGNPNNAAGDITAGDVTSLVQHSGDFRFYRTNGTINEIYFQVNATAPYWRGNVIYHAGNVPTWNQNTTGNAATVTINYNNDTNSTYQMLWGSGNSVYGTAQVYLNPSTDTIYAQGGITDSGFSRITTPRNGFYQTQTSSVTGAIKIKQPFINGGQMSKMTVKIYEYITGRSYTITVGGHRDVNNWYNVFAYQNNDQGNGDVTVRFGHDGTNNCIWIGEVGQVWSYPQVFITDVQNGYASINSTWNDSWSITFETSFNTVMTSRVAKMNAKGDGTNASGTWGINVTGTAGSAPNASNLNASYGLTTGNGNGLKFWGGSDTYKIHFGNGAEYWYGPVTDYSIKCNIDSVGATRGFTWGQNGVTPIAALNVGNGNMQIAGTFTTGGSILPLSNGTLNLGSSGARWNTVFTSDLSLSNGIGDYTIVEGENDLFLYNNKQNKVYKFMLQEVNPNDATPKRPE
jgi:hypothetical protein